jgi:hypothetical protein
MSKNLNESRFYVYILLDPRKGVLTPFYVGKGSGQRVLNHFNPSSKRKSGNILKNSVLDKIRTAGLQPSYAIIQDQLTEIDAFRLERALVARFGRRNLGEGILTNLTDGGDGCSRVLVSEDTREKMRQRMHGAGSPTFGVGHTKEAREKMSKSQKERVARGEVTRHSEEWKQHLRDNNPGIIMRKTVLKLAPDATIVETYESLTAAAKACGRTKSNMLQYTVNDGSIPLNGFFYRYADSADITSEGIKDAAFLLDRRAKHERRALSGKQVKKVADDGEIIYESLKAASREHPHLKYATIWAAIKDERSLDNARWYQL